MKMPFEDNTFDIVYEVEATAHAPSKLGVYSEAFRVLKPGGVFCGYEWTFTKKVSSSLVIFYILRSSNVHVSTSQAMRITSTLRRLSKKDPGCPTLRTLTT